jgi:hypothetical protein
MHRAPALALCACSSFALACTAPTADEPTGTAAQAEQAGSGSTVDFAGCREVANVGLAPTANLRPLVPAQFQLAGGSSASTPFVVRTVHCDAISVDGGKSRAGNILQIGAVIIAPDGDGDINNYTLFYDTTDPRLADALKKAGAPARHVEGLEESLQLAPDGSGVYSFSSPSPELTFAGPVGAPSATIPFTANWWFSGDGGTVKMASAFPELDFAGDSVTLTVPAGTPLANDIGATTVSSWPALALFDHFPSAHMVVTIR